MKVPGVDFLFIKVAGLTLSWPKSVSYRNQSTDLQSKSMDRFLYDRDLHPERVKYSTSSYLEKLQNRVKLKTDSVLPLLEILLKSEDGCVDQFPSNVRFLYPLKTLENLTVF